MAQPDEPVSVNFPVEKDEGGYPTVSREQIWCLFAGDDRFTVDNIPFYARDVSMGDEVATEMRGDERWFTKVVNPSRNTTVRVFARRPETHLELVTMFESFGGLTEKMESSPLIAVSFPPSADIAGAMNCLDRESEAGNLAFEESCVRYRQS